MTAKCTTAEDTICQPLSTSLAPFVAAAISFVGACVTIKTFPYFSEERKKKSKKATQFLAAAGTAFMGYLDTSSDIAFVIFEATGLIKLLSIAFIALPLLGSGALVILHFRKLRNNPVYAENIGGPLYQQHVKVHTAKYGKALFVCWTNPRLTDTFFNENEYAEEWKIFSKWALLFLLSESEPFGSGDLFLTCPTDVPQMALQIAFMVVK